MKSPLSLLGRIAFLLLVLVLLVIGGLLAWFTSWKSDALASLDEASEIAQTPLGPVEYMVRGEGPAVLIFHDAPGGYDQARVYAEGLEALGFKVIAASRPGYLRTPLASGLFPEQQADLMAALMDNLGIPSAAIVGVGSGGPAAMAFALRQPRHISKLVLLSAVTKSQLSSPWTPDKSTQAGTLTLAGLTGDVGSWIAVMLAARDPGKILSAVLKWGDAGDETARQQVAEAVLNDPLQLAWFRELVGSWAPLSPRETGTRNDVTNDRNLPKLALATIAVPTLVIHGSLDKNAPFADAQAAAAAIPGARFVSVPGVGHLVFLGPLAAQIRRDFVDFLSSPATPTP